MTRRPTLSRADLVDAALLGPAFFALAALTITLTRFDGGVAFIWLATSPLLVRLTITPPARWVVPLSVCVVANLVATTLFGLGPRAAPIMATANVIEAMLGAWLLRRSGHGARCFETVAGVRAFILAACVAGPLASAVPAALGAFVGTRAPIWLNMLHWFAGHALGAITVAPIVLLVTRGDLVRWRRRASKRDAAAAAALIAACAAAMLGCFWQQRAPLLFLPMLPMMVATIRLGRFGAAATTMLLAAIGGGLSISGHGPVSMLDADTGMRALFFQGYLACAALLVLPVAALLKEHRALVTQLSDSQAKYRVIVERTGDAVLDVAIDGTIRYVSPAFGDIVSRMPADLVGTRASDIVEPADREAVQAIHLAALAERGRAHPVEFRPFGHGDARWLEATLRAVATADGRSIGVIATVRDVTERKAAERELAIQASTDPLTGLANRRAFEARLANAVKAAATGRSTSVALFDLDRFKAVNDGYGHAAGDAVLRAFAEIARSTLRSADCIGRIGGEEFAVLMTDVSPIEAAAAGDRLRRALRSTAIGIDADRSIQVTVSVGVATVRPGLDADAVLRAADSALYRAKASGRDCLRRAA